MSKLEWSPGINGPCSTASMGGAGCTYADLAARPHDKECPFYGTAPEGAVCHCATFRRKAAEDEAIRRAVAGRLDRMMAFEAKLAHVMESAIAEACASCWQCEAPLGTTDDCLTCAAKRAEDRASIRAAFREGMEAATPMLVARARERGILPEARTAPRGPDTCGGCGEVHMAGEECVRDTSPKVGQD